MGRFINADGVMSGADGSLQGANLFAYCFNNPVNLDDSDGNWPNWLKVTIGAVATVAAVAITVATGGAAAPVLIGVAASTVGGAAFGAVNHRITTGSWEGAGEAALDGAADGFMWGGIGALGSSAVSAIPKITKAANAAKSDPIKKALKQLDSSGLRPGQTSISRSRVMELVNNFDSTKAQSCVYSNGATRFLVDGHHTTVASTILGKGTCMNMGAVTSQLPSATNVYWSKNWYEFGKTVIKIMD